MSRNYDADELYAYALRIDETTQRGNSIGSSWLNKPVPVKDKNYQSSGIIEALSQCFMAISYISSATIDFTYSSCSSGGPSIAAYIESYLSKSSRLGHSDVLMLADWVKVHAVSLTYPYSLGSIHPLCF